MTLIDDYRYCENIIKENSKSFYKAFSILPREKRNSIYTVYAFCRHADDTIDLFNSIDKLLKLENDLDRFTKGNIPDTPLFRALEDTFNRFPIDTEPFYDMIKGQKMDFNFTQPKDMAEFERYCYYVAGSVGLMLLPIIARENSENLREVGLGLGEAMQITNILRDIGEDYRQGRIYIPVDLLDEFPRAIESIKTNIINDDFIKVWESLAFIAEKKYKVFFKNLKLFDKDSRIAVASSALFYGEIMNVVRKNGYNCLSKRQYVSSFDALNSKLNSILTD